MCAGSQPAASRGYLDLGKFKALASRFDFLLILTFCSFMIVLLLAYSLVQSSFGEAGPIPSLLEGRDLSPGDQENKRTLWTITWSCLTTIFLCTWVTVHPNVAFGLEKQNMGWFEEWISHPLRGFLSHKLPLFLWALFVPEYILAWSIRQYLNAGAIQKKGKFLLLRHLDSI